MSFFDGFADELLKIARKVKGPLKPAWTPEELAHHRAMKEQLKPIVKSAQDFIPTKPVAKHSGSLEQIKKQEEAAKTPAHRKAQLQEKLQQKETYTKGLTPTGRRLLGR